MGLKILICGDSFSADWKEKTGNEGWPNFLAKEYDVTNSSQAGCGQYKIYKQLKKQNLSKFDVVIVSHTSPYRIHVNRHPIHSADVLHKNCDLIYEDLKAHKEDSEEVSFLVDYFEKYFDLEYAEYVHSLICRDIENLFENYLGTVVHIRNILWDDLYEFQDMMDNSDVFKNHRGTNNHFDSVGNLIVYERIKSRIGR